MTEKKKYKVVITETFQKTVLIDASSEKEARQRAQDAWKNLECTLENNFQGVEFHVFGEADGSIEEKELDIVEPKGGLDVEAE